MKIRMASASLVLTAGLALVGASACGKGDKYEYVTTDTVGDCDAGDWATRETDPESMQECAGKLGPDPDSDKPHKVKKTTKPKKPASTKTKRDKTTKKSRR